MSIIYLARNPASFASQLLLDAYPGAAFAYSLQQLRTGVTNVVDVRRSSDSAVLAVTAQQIVDGTLLAWVGAGNNGLVTRMYDQTGNGRHATQTVPANQPQIVANGALITTNGKPALRFNGTSHRMDIPAVSFSLNNFYAHVVAKTDVATGTQFFFSNPDSNRVYLPILLNGVFCVGYADTASKFDFGSSAVTNQYLTQINAGATTANAWRNNLASTPVSSVSTVESGINLSIGSYNKGGVITNYLSGTIQECVFYTSDQSANRAGIAAAVNALHGIY